MWRVLLCVFLVCPPVFADVSVTLYNMTAGRTGVLRMERETAPGIWDPVQASTGAVPPGGSFTFVVSDFASSFYLEGHRVRAGFSTYPEEYTDPQGWPVGAFYIGGSAPEPQTNCVYQFPLRNNTTSVLTFYAASNMILEVSKSLVLGPGQSGVLTFEAPCAGSNAWSVLYVPPYGEPDSVDVVPSVVPVGEDPGSLSPAVNVTDSGPVDYNPAVNGNNIAFSGTNDSQEGFGALYDAITKFAAQTDANLRRIASNSVSGGSGTLVVSNNVVVTNILGGDGDIVGAIQDLHQSVTNAWRTGADGQGLEFMSNHVAGLDGMVEGADNGLSTALESLVPSGTFDVPNGGGSFWEVTLYPGAPPFNFRPSSYLGEMFSVAKQLISWIIVVGYVFLVLKDIYGVVSTIGSGSQLLKPRLDAQALGTGGDWGAALVPFYVGAFLVAYAALITVIVGAVVVFLGGEISLTLALNPFSGVTGAAAAGVGESAQFFPWSVFFSGVVSYAVWRVSMTTAVTAFVVWLKLLIGG